MTTKLRLGDRTVITRKSRFSIFSSWLGDNPITSQSIEKFFYYLKTEKKLTNTSLNSYLEMFRSLDKYCVDRGVCPSFIQGFKPFKEEEPFIDPLTDVEIERLIQTRLKGKNDEVYRDLTAFISFTGCRLSEALNLQCQYVDLTEGKVSFVNTKTKRVRKVYFVSVLKNILARCIKSKKANELVFTTPRGCGVYQEDFGKDLHRRALACGITKNVHPHILRHSYATAAYDDRGDIYLVKEIMGHNDIQSTLRYTHISNKRVKDGQVNHPFNQKYIDPTYKIKKLEEMIESLHLLDDTRFDRVKAKEALDECTTRLYKAIQ